MGMMRTLFIHLQRRRAPRRTKLVSRATGSGRLRVAPPAALRWLYREGAGHLRRRRDVSYGVAARSRRVAHSRHGYDADSSLSICSGAARRAEQSWSAERPARAAYGSRRRPRCDGCIERGPAICGGAATSATGSLRDRAVLRTAAMGMMRTLFIHLQRRRAPRRTKLVSRATGSGRLRVAPPAALRWLYREGAGHLRRRRDVSYGVAARSRRVAHSRHGYDADSLYPFAAAPRAAPNKAGQPSDRLGPLTGRAAGRAAMAVSRGGRPFAAAPRRQLRGRCAIAPCCAQPPWV